jgi:hypothetical protein
MQAGPDRKVLATSSLGQPVLSSPSLSSGKISARGKAPRFAIAKP